MLPMNLSTMKKKKIYRSNLFILLQQLCEPVRGKIGSGGRHLLVSSNTRRLPEISCVSRRMSGLTRYRKTPVQHTNSICLNTLSNGKEHEALTEPNDTFLFSFLAPQMSMRSRGDFTAGMESNELNWGADYSYILVRALFTLIDNKELENYTPNFATIGGRGQRYTRTKVC